MTPRLMIKQKITAMVNKYHIMAVNPDGTEGEIVGLAQQKRIALKEKVTFYTNEKREKVSFTFRAEKVMDIHGRFFVEDASGNLIGMFKKEFKASLVNSTWKILDRDGNEQIIVKESNETVALLRRFIGYIPVLGELAEIVMAFFKYHFSFIDLATSQEVAAYTKTTLFRDHYTLATNDEVWQRVDWRVLAAMSIALDALQSR